MGYCRTIGIATWLRSESVPPSWSGSDLEIGKQLHHTRPCLPRLSTRILLSLRQRKQLAQYLLIQEQTHSGWIQARMCVKKGTSRMMLRRLTRTKYLVCRVLRQIYSLYSFNNFKARNSFINFYFPELIRSISDPEHRNMTLEQLAVVSAPQITFDPRSPNQLTVEFTPTVPHCGMSTFIGQGCGCTISEWSNLDAYCDARPLHPGSTSAQPAHAVQGRHSRKARITSERASTYVTIRVIMIARFLIPPIVHTVNKQLNDKERVAAALENPALVEVLEQCLSTVGDSPETAA